nr:Voltage-gated hydrogen channel 1 [Biomphalaria glabrata]
MKIACSGSHFFKRKIQVFDAIVIIASFAVDLTFIKGLAEFAVDDSIFVLVFLLPWRVIRVVNSLVMAVIDHEHVKLRLLYSRKKKLDKTVETLRNETDELKVNW